MAALHFDHNVALDLARRLLSAGHLVVTARSLGLEAADDEEHFLIAAQTGRILITHNQHDFVMLHRAWLRWSDAWQVPAAHSGILVLPQSPQFPSERLAREVETLLAFGPPLIAELYTLRSSGSWYRWQPGGVWIPSTGE